MYFEGWHQHFASPDEALNWFAMGLISGICRLTVTYRGSTPVSFTLELREGEVLGLLGPKKRAEKILADLEKSGTAISPAQRARLHAPVGLDLGAEAPEQVALSILAEMQAALGDRDARPLRERTRPIHE